jgi:hypothetical protein
VHDHVEVERRVVANLVVCLAVVLLAAFIAEICVFASVALAFRFLTAVGARSWSFAGQLVSLPVGLLIYGVTVVNVFTARALGAYLTATAGARAVGPIVVIGHVCGSLAVRFGSKSLIERGSVRLQNVIESGSVFFSYPWCLGMGICLFGLD